MAGRGKLTFDAVKATKAAPPAEAETTQAETVKRSRGRPRKREGDGRLFGMTLRIDGDLRRALRRVAEEETDAQGRVVSVHDVILAAIESHLAKRR